MIIPAEGPSGAADYPDLKAVNHLLGSEARLLIPDIQQKIMPYLLRLYRGVTNESGEFYSPNEVREIAFMMAVDLYMQHVLNSTGKELDIPDIATLVGRPERKFVPKEKPE